MLSSFLPVVVLALAAVVGSLLFLRFLRSRSGFHIVAPVLSIPDQRLQLLAKLEAVARMYAGDPADPQTSLNRLTTDVEPRNFIDDEDPLFLAVVHLLSGHAEPSVIRSALDVELADLLARRRFQRRIIALSALAFPILAFGAASSAGSSIAALADHFGSPTTFALMLIAASLVYLLAVAHVGRNWILDHAAFDRELIARADILSLAAESIMLHAPPASLKPRLAAYLADPAQPAQPVPPLRRAA